jgi:hypothetical protein
MRVEIAVLCLLLPAVAAADEVQLVSGGRLRGVIVDRTPTHVILEVGPGRIALPNDRVVGIAEGATALAEYRRRAERLTEQDLAGWLDLGRWAHERDLLTQAREAFEHAARIQPDSAEAQLALGRVFHAGRWVTPEEAYRAQGLVLFEGRWVTPSERSEQLRLDMERQARAEAEARAREAEARARAAEAEAARAEAAYSEPYDEGIPLGWAYWGSGGWPVGYPDRRPHPSPRHPTADPGCRTARTARRPPASMAPDSLRTQGAGANRSWGARGSGRATRHP